MLRALIEVAVAHAEENPFARDHRRSEYGERRWCAPEGLASLGVQAEHFQGAIAAAAVETLTDHRDAHIHMRTLEVPGKLARHRIQAIHAIVARAEVHTSA